MNCRFPSSNTQNRFYATFSPPERLRFVEKMKYVALLLDLFGIQEQNHT